MKNLMLLMASLFMAASALAQRNIKVDIWPQPSKDVHISLVYSRVTNPYAIGQGFTYNIENLTDYELDVSFEIVAKTVCGNEVADNAVNLLRAREKSGGGDELFGDAMVSFVKKQDCEGNKIVIAYDNQGNPLTGINRIESVYIRKLSVKRVAKKPADKKAPEAIEKKEQKQPEEKKPEKIVNQKPAPKSNAPAAKKAPAGKSIYVYVSGIWAKGDVSDDVYYSDVVDIAALDLSYISKRKPDGTEKTKKEIYREGAADWFSRKANKSFGYCYVQFKEGDEYEENRCANSSDESCFTYSRSEMESLREASISMCRKNKSYDHLIEVKEGKSISSKLH